MKRGQSVSESGSAIVEFALVVPLYFLIVFGLISLGLVFAGYCGAEYASQQGVRYAIVHGADSSTPCTNATITTYVAPYLWAAQLNSSTVTTTWTPNNAPGNTVTVRITLSYQTGIPFSTLNHVTVGTSSQGTILY